MHCIASHRCLPPPLIPRSSTRSVLPAVHCSSGWSGAAGARALWPCSWSFAALLLRVPFSSQPSPAQPNPSIAFQQDNNPCLSPNFLSMGPSHLTCLRYTRRPAVTLALVGKTQHGVLRCDTIFSRNVIDTIQHSGTAQQSPAQGEPGAQVRRRPSFKDPPPWPEAGRLGNVTRGPACAQSHATSPQFALSMIPV